jgi:hypothetical protein
MKPYEILFTDKLDIYDAEWELVSDITPKSLVTLETSGGFTSWIYMQNELIWLPKVNCNDAMQASTIHKLLVNMKRYITVSNLMVSNDEYGLVSSAFRCPSVYFYNEEPAIITEIRSKNKVKYLVTKEDTTCFVALNDDVLTNLDIFYKCDHLKSCVMLFNTNSEVTVSLYLSIAPQLYEHDFDIKKLITCGSYTIVLIEKCNE